MSGLLAGKAAVITGAASGIGAAAARLFAREGAQLVLADIDEATGEALATELRQAGAAVLFKTTDVSAEADAAALATAAASHCGRLDCAFNSAGITGTPAKFEETELAEWQRVLAVNLSGIFLCMKHEIRAMKECIAAGAQEDGAIVNVSSGSGVIATPHMASYSAAKHGVLGLTKTAAVENAREGIRVNAVLPGSTWTPMMEASVQGSKEVEQAVRSSLVCGRFGRPEEVAEAALWLCSKRASFVSGESMLVDYAAVAR